MKISLLQEPFVCGDIDKNLATLLVGCDKAKQQGADLLITPFMFLTGYPLFDLVKHSFIHQKVNDAINRLFLIKDLAVIISCPLLNNDEVFICQLVIYNGSVLLHQEVLLDSELSLDSSAVFEFQGSAIGLTFRHNFTAESENLSSADFVIVQQIQAFYAGIRAQRQEEIKSLAQQLSVPVISVHSVGANDEYLFDGESFAVNSQQQIQFQVATFNHGLFLIEFKDADTIVAAVQPLINNELELKYHAIIYGLQQYLAKTGFSKICFGLSGGIDSALVLAIATQAIGAENCEVFILPSQYSADISRDLAVLMAQELKVKYSLIPISGLFADFNQALATRFQGLTEDITEENIQARIRGVLLMALSNKTKAMLLCTSNKSEVAVGYGTLYGDTNGGFAPIKDLLKIEVFAMSHWINQSNQRHIIPQAIIDRKPSAELKLQQTDQDSLPEYEVLDAIIKLILLNKNVAEIVAQGFEFDTVTKVMRLLRASEYKKQQGVLGPKLSLRSFGKEWNYPITDLPISF